MDTKNQDIKGQDAGENKEQLSNPQTENKPEKDEKTVPLSTLLEERKKRQDLEKRLEELGADVKEQKQKSPAGIPVFKLGKTDMLDLSAEDLENKVNEYMQSTIGFVREGLKQEMSSHLSQSEAKRQIDTELGKHAFFEKAKNEDPDLYEFALQKLAGELGKNDGEEKNVAAIVAATAKEYSRLFVKRADEQSGKGEGKEENPVPPVPGAAAAEVAHMKEKNELKGKSFSDIRAIANRAMAGAVNSLLAKGKT